MMSTTNTRTLKEIYDDQGYVVVQGLLPDAVFPELKDACTRAIGRTRDGSWKHRRVVGKQFPPFGDANPDSWGVQHIMHPDLGEPAFAKWYASDKLRGVAKELLQCGDEDLQMELFNMLINPLGHDFALRWHRDDIRETATEEEERQALGIWHHGVQWNAAIYKDSCLYLVPGSHKDPRTQEQRALSSTQAPPENPLEMPGAIQLTLQPGESVFYNSNILHCATYDHTAERATLHGTMGDSRAGATRARNILQHGLDWMEDPKFRSTLDDKGKVMLDKLLVLHRSTDKENIGYSLDA